MSINPITFDLPVSVADFDSFSGEILFYINLFTLPLSGLSSSISLSLAPPCSPF